MSVVKAMVTEKNGEISCSVEETNRIRKALGLRPLDLGPSSAQRREQAAQDAHKQQIAEKKKAAAAAEMAAALQKSRERRQLHARMKGKTLGEQLGKEKQLSAADWAKGFQVASATAKRKSKKRGRRDTASRTAQALAEQDAAAMEAYSATDLAGLKLQHSASAFQTGSQVVLTLKDAGVLDDDDDELQNVNLAESDSRKHAAKEAARSRAAYLDGEDDSAPKAAMVLTADGRAKHTEEMDADNELQALQASRNATKVELGTLPRKQASDYYTKDEMVAFAKPKRKKSKKLRKKSKKSKRARLELEAETVDGADYGSRRHGGAAAAAARKRDRDENSEKAQAYEAALRKESKKVTALAHDDAQAPRNDDTAVTTKATDPGKRGEAEKVVGTAFGFGASGGLGAQSGKHRKYTFAVADADTGADEDDDAELAASLARARRFARKRRKTSHPEVGDVGNDDATDVAHAVEALKQRQQARLETDGKRGSKGVVFTSTSEFSRQIQSRMTEKRRDDALLAQERAKAAAVARARAALQQAKLGLSVAKKTKDAEEPTTDVPEDAAQTASAAADSDDATGAGGAGGGAFADEPLASASMADTLRLIRRNGQTFTKVSYAGRQNDSRMSEKEREDLRTGVKLEYRDEMTGQPLTQKEAFRQLSYKFHGTAPGKKKQEKRLKKLLEEYRIRTAATGDTPLGMNAALRRQQQAKGQAFVVLNKGST